MIRSISCFIILLLAFSCAKRPGADKKPEKVKRIKTNELVERLEFLSTQRTSTFYSKISSKYSDTTRSVSFKNSVRLIADSALNTIITYAAIPVVNGLITKDSLKVVNKREKCLIETPLSYIKETFGVDFSFRNIEELLLGLPLDFDTTLKYFQIHEPYRYVVSSHRKMKIKRLDKKGDRNDKEDDDIVFKYYLDSTAQFLDGIEIFSPNDTTTVRVTYADRQWIDSLYFMPHTVDIEIFLPRNNISLRMSYNKVEINQPQELYFIVPEGYEGCE